jgi:hypothetical protein
MDTGINSQKNATDFPHHYSLPLQFFWVRFITKILVFRATKMWTGEGNSDNEGTAPSMKSSTNKDDDDDDDDNGDHETAPARTNTY